MSTPGKFVKKPMRAEPKAGHLHNDKTYQRPRDVRWEHQKQALKTLLAARKTCWVQYSAISKIMVLKQDTNYRHMAGALMEALREIDDSLAREFYEGWDK